MLGFRLSSFALAGIVLVGAQAAQARPNLVPLTAQTPMDLKYAGSVNHSNGTGHTYLAHTMAECQAMVADSQYAHAHHTLSNCSQTTYTTVPCEKRGFFELVAPADGDDGSGVTTIMVHLPGDFVRAVGDLRERYRIDEYEAQRAKLGGE